jgi:hypothetical protein
MFSASFRLLYVAYIFVQYICYQIIKTTDFYFPLGGKKNNSCAPFTLDNGYKLAQRRKRNPFLICKEVFYITSPSATTSVSNIFVFK